jgi:hypothetical protein
MSRYYVCTMAANALVTTALPWFQLNVAAGVPVSIVGIEITNETSTTSAILIAQAQRRSTASTTFANTVQAPTKLGPPADPAASTTFSWGITTAAGTAVDTPSGPRWAFNALSGLPWVPTPQQEITLATVAASWWTLHFATAPSPALTISANIYIRE